MRRRIHEYNADGITVTFEPKRCTHALECIRALPQVFSLQRRRWLDADQASPDEIAEAVQRCPTGALHYRRKDGGAEEAVPEKNSARVVAYGPLYVQGNLEIQGDEGSMQETRVALCRCGASETKPFCDNSHERIGFGDDGAVNAVQFGSSPPASDMLRISFVTDGPCVIEGSFRLTAADGTTSHDFGPRTDLCSCGRSRAMPFCDGSHRQIGHTPG